MQIDDIEHNNDSELLDPPVAKGRMRQLVKEPTKFYRNLTEQHGDVTCYRPAPDPAYHISDPEHVKHVLVRNHANYTKETHTNKMFRTRIADGLLTSEGETWRDQRRAIQPAFRRSKMAELDGIVTGLTSKMLDEWEAPAADGQGVDVVREISTLIAHVTAKALFGVDIGSHSDTIEQIIQAGNAVSTAGIKKAWDIGDEVVNTIIEARRDNPTEFDDLYSVFFKMNDQHKTSADDVTQLRQQLATFILAGYETTASAITWAVFLLARHPHVLERLQTEVDIVLGERVPIHTDLGELIYTRQVFDETLRLYPSAWMMGRRAIGDDRVGNYRIPAGAVLAISPYVLQRHHAFWENPDAFIPERFEGDQKPVSYMPFGAGPRVCVGMNFALLEALLIIPMVVQRFSLRAVSDAVVPMDAKFVLRPGEALPVMLTKR